VVRATGVAGVKTRLGGAGGEEVGEELVLLKRGRKEGRKRKIEISF
jgi:hypothetical protein